MTEKPVSHFEMRQALQVRFSTGVRHLTCVGISEYSSAVPIYTHGCLNAFENLAVGSQSQRNAGSYDMQESEIISFNLLFLERSSLSNPSQTNACLTCT